MNEFSEQPTTNPEMSSDDLPRKLRQISDALWEAAQRKDLNEVNLLLDARQEILAALAEAKPLDDRQRRELMAIRAADKYLIRQLDNELEWLDRRLRGVSQRRTAAAGYRVSGPHKTHLTRTG
jgi:hypothetical protein